MQDQKESHEFILNLLYKKYQAQDETFAEFTWDGPSNWDLWQKSRPRILFLVKESRKGYHPNVPLQPLSNKFSQNIGRWKNVIQNSIFGDSLPFDGDNRSLKPSNLDDIAIVEVKKINEENVRSSRETILEYARTDKDLLQKQVEAIEPQIVICCGTSDAYDIIFGESHEKQSVLVSEGNCVLWHLDERLVLEFYHPTTNNTNEYGIEDDKRIQILKRIFSNPLVIQIFNSLRS